MNTTQSTDMSPPATQRQNVSQESKNGDMNRERILEIARAAGMVRTHPGMAPEVLAFAALVATAEREACAKACEAIQGQGGPSLCADAIRSRWCSMTRDDVIRMAQEAGIDCDTDGDIWGSTNGALERFAALVANAEREECAKACEELHHTWRWDDEPDSTSGPRDCAAAIRARKP